MSEPVDDLACMAFVELVTEYLEGVLTDPERSRLELHLAQCPGCETYLDQLRETIRTVGELPAQELSAATRGRLREAFRSWSAQR